MSALWWATIPEGSVAGLRVEWHEAYPSANVDVSLISARYVAVMTETR